MNDPIVLVVEVSMLSRGVVIVWLAWAGLMALSAALLAARVGASPPLVPLGLLAVMLGAAAAVSVGSGWRTIRGPGRRLALARVLVGSAPVWFLAGHALAALRPAVDRSAHVGRSSKLLMPLGRAVMDVEARARSWGRTTGHRVVLLGPPAADSRAQVEAMDRHVAAVEGRLGRAAAWPVVWVRGRLLLGLLWQCTIRDLAIGTPAGYFPPHDGRLTAVDKAMAAASVINGLVPAAADPPYLLAGGWGQLDSGTPREWYARRAQDEYDRGDCPPLRVLVAPGRYWSYAGAGDTQGPPLVDFLLRRFGPTRFLDLYATARQPTFDADCRRCLGVGLDDLDAAFRADVAAVAGPPRPVDWRWLEDMPLAPGVDRTTWRRFLADYLGAARRVAAAHDPSRLTVVAGTLSAAGVIDETSRSFARSTLARSGPISTLVVRDSWGERRLLATPDASFWARTRPDDPAAPWLIPAHPADTPGQEYRHYRYWTDPDRFPSGYAIRLANSLVGFRAYLSDYGHIAELRVAEVGAADDRGRPTVRVRFETDPTYPAAGPSYAFEFDPGDLYAARSFEQRAPGGQLTRLAAEYDRHDDGATPLLRAVAITSTTGGVTVPVGGIRVEARDFGPIPPAEFAPRHLLAWRLVHRLLASDRPRRDIPTFFDLLAPAPLALGVGSLVAGLGLGWWARRRPRG